jgi:hypothetical protein
MILPRLRRLRSGVLALVRLRRDPNRPRNPWRLTLTPEQQALADRHLAAVRAERTVDDADTHGGLPHDGYLHPPERPSIADGRQDLQFRHKRGDR